MLCSEILQYSIDVSKDNFETENWADWVQVSSASLRSTIRICTHWLHFFYYLHWQCQFDTNAFWKITLQTLWDMHISMKESPSSFRSDQNDATLYYITRINDTIIQYKIVLPEAKEEG